MRVLHGMPYGRYGAPVQQVEPMVQDNQSLVPVVKMLQDAIRQMAAKHETDMVKVSQAFNAMAEQLKVVLAQNKALAQALTQFNAGVRAGYAPRPVVPSMPGQPVDIGVPTHALRPTDIDLVAGGSAGRTTVDRMAADNADGRTSAMQAYEDAVMYGDGEAEYE